MKYFHKQRSQNDNVNVDSEPKSHIQYFCESNSFMCSKEAMGPIHSPMRSSTTANARESSKDLSEKAKNSKPDELRFKFVVSNEGYIFKESTPEKQQLKGIYISPSSTSKSSDTPSMVESLLDDDDEDEENNKCEATSNDEAENTFFQTKNVTIPNQRLVTPEKIESMGLSSASCLASCLFRDTLSDLTKIITSTQNSINQTPLQPEIEEPRPNSSNKETSDVLEESDGTNHMTYNVTQEQDCVKIERLNDFDSWSQLCGSNCDGENVAPSPQRKIKRALIRNRATNPLSRKARIQRLRRELAPFDINSIESLQVDKANSFQIKKSSDFVGSRKQSTSGLSPSINSMTSVMKSVQICGNMDIKEMQINAVSLQDDDLCYDSDPGETKAYVKRQSKGTFKEQSYLRHSEHLTAVDLNESHFFLTNFHDNASTLKETMNTTLILIWHRSPSIMDEESSPIAVHAWVEYGMQLRSTLVQPKFMWKPIHTTETKEQGKFAVDYRSVHTVDLLDIIRILDIDKVNRDKYPLANNSRSFMIEAYDKEFLFECKCHEAKSRFVYGLKLAVARLGSKIIVGDKRVFNEFFEAPHCIENEVPGEAPSFSFI